MSTFTELINGVVERNSATMEELTDLCSKAFESLKYADIGAYNELMGELEQLYYYIDEDKAREIVRAMKPYGEMWNMDTIRDYIASKGETDTTAYYLVMNMARNDYSDTARSVDMENDANFYYMLAYDFIHDADGKPHKVERYFS